MKLNLHSIKYLAALLCYLFLFYSTSSVSSDKPIIIGLDADMSAVAAEGGIAIKRGAQLAINEINQSGGVLGRHLELVVRDHRGNPARGLANINYFSQQENVVAVLGGVHTPVALHELPAIHKHKMIYLSPWAAGTPIVDNGFDPNYVYRVSVRDEHAGYVLLKHGKSRNFNKFGLLLERTGWGRSNQKSMQAAANKLGLSVVGVEWFNWKEKSMQSQLKSLKEAGAEAILLVANAPEGAAIIKGIAAMDKVERLPVLSHWGIAGGNFVNQAGLESIRKVDLNVLQTYSFLAPYNDVKMQSLLNAYKNKYDSTVNSETITAASGIVHAYDLIHILAKAIKNANTIDREVVRDFLEKIGKYNGVLKEFNPPFSKSKHDALNYDDYIITIYNSNGYLVPAKE
ncbi:MAG: ABC transporter substrate-binding protein [Cellvibrionaceae bacterium]